MRLMGSQNSWVKKNTTAAGRPPAAEDRVGQSCPVLANPRRKQLKSMLRLSHAQRAREREHLSAPGLVLLCGSAARVALGPAFRRQRRRRPARQTRAGTRKLCKGTVLAAWGRGAGRGDRTTHGDESTSVLRARRCACPCWCGVREADRSTVQVQVQLSGTHSSVHSVRQLTVARLKRASRQSSY